MSRRNLFDTRLLYSPAIYRSRERLTLENVGRVIDGAILSAEDRVTGQWVRRSYWEELIQYDPQIKTTRDELDTRLDWTNGSHLDETPLDRLYGMLFNPYTLGAMCAETLSLPDEKGRNLQGDDGTMGLLQYFWSDPEPGVGNISSSLSGDDDKYWQTRLGLFMLLEKKNKELQEGRIRKSDYKGKSDLKHIMNLVSQGLVHEPEFEAMLSLLRRHGAKYREWLLGFSQTMASSNRLNLENWNYHLERLTLLLDTDVHSDFVRIKDILTYLRILALSSPDYVFIFCCDSTLETNLRVIFSRGNNKMLRGRLLEFIELGEAITWRESDEQDY